MKRVSGFFCSMLLIFGIAGAAQADLIDFETYSNLQPLGVVATSTNVVTFSVGSPGSGPAYVADVGNDQTAFAPNDTPAGSSAGLFFLTDETAGPRTTLDYFMEFSIPVFNLSLDLYDYRVDGGPRIGDTATLTVFSDLFATAVGSSVFTIPDSNPVDGNVERLAVLTPVAPILSASVVFSIGDVGTGIDNIEFTTVPEPATVLLIGTGLMGFAVPRIRARMKK